MIPPEARNIAILLKMIGDDPLLVEYLNEDNLSDILSLELYDGVSLEITPRGKKLIKRALPELENSVVDWCGEFTRNPKRAKLASGSQTSARRALSPAKKPSRISLKIKKLIREGYGPTKAAAIAYSMSRKGKLGPKGGKKKNPMTKEDWDDLFSTYFEEVNPAERKARREIHAV